MDKYELVERYEALGDEDDFLAARRLFEAELTGRASALDRRQYGYLLECHGRRTLRRAVDQYEQSMALDPDQDKVRTSGCRPRPRWASRTTRSAATATGSPAHPETCDVIATGLQLAPDDPKLTYDRGEVKAARGDPQGALADWRRAHELDPEDFGPVYMSAFLLEHEGRLAEAAGAWRHILEYADAHDWELTAIWPRQELQRLQKLLDDRQHPGR